MTEQPYTPPRVCPFCGAFVPAVGYGYCAGCGRLVMTPAASPPPTPQVPWWAAGAGGYVAPASEGRRRRSGGALLIAVGLVAALVCAAIAYRNIAPTERTTVLATPTGIVPWDPNWTPGPLSTEDSTAVVMATPTAKATPRATQKSNLVKLPKLTFSVSGATVKYFAVSGSTSAQLMASDAKNSATDCGSIDYSWYSGDTRPAACAQWYFTYHYLTVGLKCSVTSVSLKQTVYLPQWTSPSSVKAPLLAWWREWMAVVKTHEAGHVALSGKWLATFKSRMVGFSCTSMKSVFDKTMGQLNAAQEAYDKTQYSSQVFPPPPD